jgi:hypothetical protein
MTDRRAAFSAGFLTLGAAVLALACSTGTFANPAAAGDTAGTLDAGGQATSEAGTTSGSSTDGAMDSATSGASPEAAGDDGGGPDGAGTEAGAIVAFDGGVNMVPPGYNGTPFVVLQIPGMIHMSDYDRGGATVAYCHAPAGTTGFAACASAKMNDWCCGPGKLCDQRNQPAICPIYRPDSDNAGLSHMNDAEPDQTPSGALYMPRHAYLSYSVTGEWLKYTVQVTQAATYSVGGVMGAPRPPQNAAPTISLDFGGGVTTGTFTVPSSMCDPGARCTEGYHVWQTDNNMAKVTFPAAGSYVMTFTLVSSFFNPEYLSFTKM